MENGGTAVVAVPDLPTNFNPSTPAGANRITNEVMAEVLPQAFVTNSNKAEVAEPGFVLEAEVHSVSPFTVVYTLNPKAVWSDGTPIGVADFVYNWHQQLQWADQLPDAGLVAGYRAISTITPGSGSTGNSSVVVTFKTPFPGWESLFRNLVPAHIASRYGWVAAFQGFDPSKVISGGPFEVTSFQPGRQLVLSRNPHYWATPASLDKIVLQVETTTEAVQGLEDGALSAAELPDGQLATEAVEDGVAGGVALSNVTSTTPVLWELCFNITSSILGTPSFRVGVEDSLYVGEITSDSVGVDDPGVTAFGFRFDIAETVKQAARTGGTARGLGGSGGSPAFSYDTSAAMTAYRAAGYVPQSDGLLAAVGTTVPVTLTLLVPSGIPAVSAAASEIRAELATAGLQVTIEAEPLDTMLGQTLPAGDYELAIAPFLLSSDAAGQATIYSDSVLPETGGSSSASASSTGGGSPVAPSSTGTTPTSTIAPGVPQLSWAAPAAVGTEPDAVEAGVVTRDVFGFEDPVVTDDLQDALTNLNPDDAASSIAAAEAQLALDVPTIPLFRSPVDCVHVTKLRFVTESSGLSGMFWDASSWAIQLRPPVTVPATAAAASTAG